MAEKPTSRNFVDSERIEVLAREAAETGEPSEELMEMFYRLARGYYDFFRGKRGNSYVLMEQDDAVQEAVIACWKALPYLGDGSAYGFFYTTVVNRYRNLFQFCSRQKRDPGRYILDTDRLVHDEDLEPSECQRLRYLQIESDRESDRKLGRRYSKLTLSQLRLVLRLVLRGVSGRCIAHRLGVAPQTISRALRRAYRRSA